MDTAAAFAAAAQSLTTEDVKTTNNNFMQQQQLSVPPQLQQRLYGPVGGAVQPSSVSLYQVPSGPGPITIHPGYGAAAVPHPLGGYQTGFNIINNGINGSRFGQNAGGFSSSNDPSSTLKSYLVMSYNTIPFEVLANYGVGSDLLRQLMELKANLNSNVSWGLYSVCLSVLMPTLIFDLSIYLCC